MDTANFLDRVLASGNYINIAWNKGSGTEITASRMFKRDDLGSTKQLFKWALRKDRDIYHSMATFVDAKEETNDRGYKELVGERKKHNAQNIKCFWVDVDVKRHGDKKSLDKCYTTQQEAILWLGDFVIRAGIPKPSILVSSGYGLHVYWVLQDEMPHTMWAPYGSAFAAMLTAEGFKCEVGITSDGVRLLRPPGTMNMKSGIGVECRVLKAGPDVDNALMLAALTPYLNVTSHPSSKAVAKPSTSVLTSGGPSANVVGLRPQGQPNMAAAAQAGVATPRPRFFAAMADAGGCGQVRESLASGGEHDTYPLWYIGFLGAATFCQDGADYIHPIGYKHVNYKSADTDAKFVQAVNEQVAKNLGYPSCAVFHAVRPSTCLGCKHWGKINSPLDVAIPRGDYPQGYQRGSNGEVQMWRKNAQGGYWDTLLAGEVLDPIVRKIPFGGFSITFKYMLNTQASTVHVVLSAVYDAQSIRNALMNQHVQVDRGKEVEVLTFLEAFTQLLRSQNKVSGEVIEPFGWATEGTTHRGFAVGGRLYRPDGSEEDAPGGDPVVMDNHTPQGDFGKWRRAADYVLQNRPDLQTIVAASFGAPLVKLLGFQGLVMDAWSVDSGVGKSSALAVAQGVWGSPAIALNLDDTHNSVAFKLGQTRALPGFWDEANPMSNNTAEAFVAFIFRLSQGREKARMGALANLRETASWETILFACANAPLLDRVMKAASHSEAGALRVFEYQITQKKLPPDPMASMLVEEARANYGHAGRAYAKYLAINYDNLKMALAQENAMIMKHVGAGTEERMLTATMTAVIIGAKIAVKLGLVALDVPQIRALLYQAFAHMRLQRKDNLLATNSGYNYEDILSKFMADNSAFKLVTDRFASGNAVVKPVLLPEDRKKCVIHISIQDRIIRIDHDAFNEFAWKHKLSPDDLVKKLSTHWQATPGRYVLGGGTAWGGIRRKVIDIRVSPNDPILEDVFFNPTATNSQTVSNNTMQQALQGGPATP